MSKLVVLQLGRGDLNQGFPFILAQLWESGNLIPMQFIGSLPAAPELPDLYRRWQLLYQSIYEALYPRMRWRRDSTLAEEIEINEEDVTNVSEIDFRNLCQELQNRINIWLKSESFRKIDNKLRMKLDPSDEIRVIIQAESDQVLQLPWHLWDFLEDYPKAVVALSAPEFELIKPLRSSPGGKVRILAILGNNEGIDIEKDRAILAQIPDAKTVFLVEPKRQELDNWLWEKQGWDILFFAGHSSSSAEERSGKIYINKTDSLTIPQLKNALKKAIAQGLRLAIFNSCEGYGLARQLAELHIPQIIVMREQVPDLVAQEFLKHFIQAFADGKSFYLAVREAGERLQGLESDFPCASWLPVISQNPAETPLIWPRRQLNSPLLPLQRILLLILLASMAGVVLFMGMRSQGMLLSMELQAFDKLMRSRPPEQPDNRLLIVTITESDVQNQPPEERAAASLSDRSLDLLLKKLERFKPSVIGLDIYRENPVKAAFPDLAKQMRVSDRLITVCKASENNNAGVLPPPEVPVKRLGFSDLVLDPDGILRRHLLAMAPASPCPTDKSFSFRLAMRYLTERGIQFQLTKQKNWQIGSTVFRDLQKNSGGYHDIDNLGHQVLLNYRSSHSIATFVTLADVLNNKLTADLVENRIVLIGTTAPSFHDYWPTPYSAGDWPNQQMPGVVVQAHAVSQILSAVLDKRPLLGVWPAWGEFLWVWCWSAIGGILACRFRTLLSWGLAAGTALGILYALSLGLLMLGYWVPLIPSALALAVTGGSVAVYIALPIHKQQYRKDCASEENV